MVDVFQQWQAMADRKRNPFFHRRPHRLLRAKPISRGLFPLCAACTTSPLSNAALAITALAEYEAALLARQRLCIKNEDLLLA